MGQLVFQSTAGGQTALVSPNPTANFALNVPAVNGNLVTTGDTGTVTSTMLASNVYTTPGTIGSGTANTGAFTTLSASSTVSGIGFNNYLASPPAIGATTPNSASVTTLTVGGAQNQQLGQGNASIMKNRIINGAMVIDQRNAGASVNATNNIYCLDRWNMSSSVGSTYYSVQQNAGSVTPPVGFANYLGATSLGAYTVSGTDSFALNQRIEGYNVADLGWGTANAKTVTLSFWVRSSLTGTFGGAFSNAALDRSYPFNYSIPVANTWTKISVTVAGDTTGTWTTTNTTGLFVWFGLGMGSTLSGTAGAWAGAGYRSATGATSVVGTSGATFYITGVQLEVGSSATGFEYVNYQTSLANCQRYYWTGTVIFNANLGTYGYPSWNFPVQMRSSPTISIVSSSGSPTVAALGTNGFYQSGGASSAGSSTVLTSTAEL